MNKKLILSLGILTCSLFLAGCKKSEPVTSTTPETKTATDGSMSEKMNEWADAVKSGSALKCSYTNTNEGQNATYEVKGKKIHITNESTGESKVITQVISDGEMMYTWEEGKKEGFKMKLPSEEELQQSKELAEQTMKNFPDFSKPEQIQKLEEDGSEVNCTPGTVSDSVFVPPTDVTFQDFSTLMENAMKKAQEGMTDEQKKEMDEAMKKMEQ